MVGGTAIAIFDLTWLTAVVGGSEVGFFVGRDDGEFWGMLFGAWIVMIGSVLAYFHMDRKLRPEWSESERVWALCFGNVELLREELNGVIAPGGSRNWKIPLVCVTIVFCAQCMSGDGVCDRSASETANS